MSGPDNQAGEETSLPRERPGTAAGWLAGLRCVLRLLSLLAVCLALCPGTAGFAQTLNLPPRAANAPTGSELAEHLKSFALVEREQEIINEILAGNVPDFLRKLRPVAITNAVEGRTNFAMLFVAPDYLAVGSDEDYLLAPLSPAAAQLIADRLGCTLPTRKMVDAIHSAAGLKLAPVPIPPSPAMTTFPVFAQHNDLVRAQRAQHRQSYPLGTLVAGDKKDVVITPKLAGPPGKVAIYGWYQTNGVPIQPLYLGHTAAWVDYSHGIRLVQQKMTVNDRPTTVAQVLADPDLASLLSDEGVIAHPRYPTNMLPTQVNQPANGAAITRQSEKTTAPAFAEFKSAGQFGELTTSFAFAPDAKIHINAPAREAFATDKPVLLIFYALPNGNTTEQTIGKTLQPGDDWHFDIQHIGAQTRFVRAFITNRTIVVAYLEAEMKSWPAWRKKHGDQQLPKILDSVKAIFAAYLVEVVLTGHSGGGSFTFGFLNTVERIPDEVVRIAFLDSNYAYDPARGHNAKLVNWLRASSQHYLCVLAYNDAVALLNGKSFVSEKGGTWGRSHAMLEDFEAQFEFVSRTNAGLATYSAQGGRIQFLLKQNPERKILHTVQVERNGFIHAMVAGTPNQGRGYEYFGARAYTKWISDR